MADLGKVPKSLRRGSDVPRAGQRRTKEPETALRSARRILLLAEHLDEGGDGAGTSGSGDGGLDERAACRWTLALERREAFGVVNGVGAELQ